MLIRINLDGSYGDVNIPMVRANEKHRTEMKVITPYPLTNIIVATYSVIGSGESTSHVVTPRNSAGIDGGNLWSSHVSWEALGLMGKYRAGLLLLSFEIREPQIPAGAINYKGETLGEPLAPGINGDFYKMANGNIWYFEDGWHLSNYVKIITTNTIEVPVAPNIKVSDEIIELPDEDFAALAGRVAVNETNISHLQQVIDSVEGADLDTLTLTDIENSDDEPKLVTGELFRNIKLDGGIF